MLPHKELHEELIEGIMRQMPESWDDCVAAESLCVDYVRHLEEIATYFGGREALERWWHPLDGRTGTENT